MGTIPTEEPVVVPMEATKTPRKRRFLQSREEKTLQEEEGEFQKLA
jgi:hypothetical protein